MKKLLGLVGLLASVAIGSLAIATPAVKAEEKIYEGQCLAITCTLSIQLNPIELASDLLVDIAAGMVMQIITAAKTLLLLGCQ